MKKSFVLKIVLAFLLFISIFCFGLYILLLSQNIATRTGNYGTTGTERKYNILITCAPSEETFARQVLRGAQSTAQKFDCSIEFYVPDTFENDTDLQKIFDYASYVEPDGLIACIPEEEYHVTPPAYKDGSPIPLITVGQYIPALPQVSYIGINYSELGRIMGNEIISFTGGKGNICILYTDLQDNQTYSMLMSELLNLTDEKKNLNIKSLCINPQKNTSKFDLFRQQLAGESPFDLIVSLSDDATVLAAQTLTEINRSDKSGIIGLSEGAESRAYYEKEIINELVVINSLEIGVRALEEIFEYKKSGYANSYIMAGIDILKRGIKK